MTKELQMVYAVLTAWAVIGLVFHLVKWMVERRGKG